MADVGCDCGTEGEEVLDRTFYTSVQTPTDDSPEIGLLVDPRWRSSRSELLGLGHRRHTADARPPPRPGCPYLFGHGSVRGGRTPTWFRTYYEDKDLRLHFETNDEGWAARLVEVRRQDSRPVIAASLEKVLHLRDHADLAAVLRYERHFGVLAEGPMDGPRARRSAHAEILRRQFVRIAICSERFGSATAASERAQTRG